MKNILTLILLLTLLSKSVKAQFHHNIHPNLSGPELLDNLIQDYKPTTVIEYDEARDLMYGIIYNENDTVRGIYSDHSIYLPPNVDPSTFLFMNSSGNGINCEHTFLRSKGADEDNGNPFSDMHHLFPTRTGVNAARGNLPFADVPDTQTNKWYWKTEVLENIPPDNIDNYSEKGSNNFEPRESIKGNIARAMFYFYTMYKTEADEADPNFFENQRETLCTWHYADPVDLLEYERTFQIAEYQNDKPNPFILDCSLSQRTYCPNQTPDCPNLLTNTKELITKNPQIKIYPNPAKTHIQINSKGINLHSQTRVVTITNIIGKPIYRSEQLTPSQRITLPQAKSGLHYLIIETKDGQIHRTPLIIQK